MRAQIACAAAAVALLTPATAPAQRPGALDPSFGNGGVASTTIGNGGRPRTAAAAPDGRLFVAGSAQDPEHERAFGVARFSADGQLDRSFGQNGTVLMQLGDGPFVSSGVSALIPQADGGVIAVGDATRMRGEQPESAVAAVRLRADGTPAWQVAYHVARHPGSGAVVDAAVQQPDGRIVIAGSAPIDDFVRDVTLVRISREDGSLDRSFGVDGVAYERRDHPYREEARVHDVVLTPAGTIVLAGERGFSCGHNRCHQPLLQAWTPDGRLDPTFATGPLGLEEIHDIAPGPDGTFLATGRVAPSGPITHAGLVRYTATGDLDPTLNPEPQPLAIPLPPGYAGRLTVGLAVQPDGRPVTAVAGSRGHVVRLLPSGDRDDSFGYGGMGFAGIDIRENGDVLLLPDGRILVVGTPEPPPGPPCPYEECYPEPRQEFALGRVMGGLAAGDLSVGRSAPVRRRAARLSLACDPPGAADCAGELKLASGRRGGAGLTFGRAGFEIEAGDRATVKVSLTRAALRRIRRAPGRRLTARVRVADAAGRVTRSRVRLVARGSLR